MAAANRPQSGARPAPEVSPLPPAERVVGWSSAIVTALALLAFLLTRGRPDQEPHLLVAVLTHASLPTAVMAGIVHAGWQGGVATTRQRRLLAWTSAGLGVAILASDALLVAALVLGLAYCLPGAAAEAQNAAGISCGIALVVGTVAALWARTTRWPGVRAAAWALTCAVVAPGLAVGLVGLWLVGSECTAYGS